MPLPEPSEGCLAADGGRGEAGEHENPSPPIGPPASANDQSFLQPTGPVVQTDPSL